MSMPPTRARRTLGVAVALALVLLPGTAAAQGRRPAPPRIAVIDSRVLFDSVPGREAAEGRFNAQIQRAQALVAEATDSLRAAVDLFSRQQGEMNPRQREASLLVLRARELALEDLVHQLTILSEQKRDELTAPLEGRIRAAVRRLQAEEGYTLILDRASMPGLAEADPGIDVTARVLRLLRQAPPLE